MERPVSQASGRVAIATYQGVGQPRRRASGVELPGWEVVKGGWVEGLNLKESKQPWADRHPLRLWATLRSGNPGPKLPKLSHLEGQPIQAGLTPTWFEMIGIEPEIMQAIKSKIPPPPVREKTKEEKLSDMRRKRDGCKTGC